MSKEAIKLQPREPFTPELINVLHSPKRVRVEFGAETIADSRETLILRSNQFLPIYFFPIASVAEGVLADEHAGSHPKLGGKTRAWNLKVGSRTEPDAAWSFIDVDRPELEALKGYVAFGWSAVDQWFEEDEEIFVHPRDPYARIDTIQSSSHVEIFLNGEIIADSKRAVLLFETHLPTRFYIPPEDIRMDRLAASSNHTRCPYKGIASYWSLKGLDGTAGKDIAWSYPEPLPEIPKIKGLIAFYPDAVDEIRLDGRHVS
jgi:uncharacterized protein (DUF427 family)